MRSRKNSPRHSAFAALLGAAVLVLCSCASSTLQWRPLVRGQFEIGNDTAYAVYEDVWKWQDMTLCRLNMYWDSTISNGIYVVDLDEGKLDRLVLDGTDDVQLVAEGRGSIAYLTNRANPTVVWINRNSGMRRSLPLPDSIRPGHSRGNLLVSDSVVTVFSNERRGDRSYRIGHSWWNGANSWTKSYQEGILWGYLPDAICVDDTTFIVCHESGEWGGGLHRLTFNSSRQLSKETLSGNHFSRLLKDPDEMVWAAGGRRHLGMPWTNDIAIVSSDSLYTLTKCTDRTRFVGSGVELQQEAAIADISYFDSTLHITLETVGILSVPVSEQKLVLNPSSTLDTVAILPYDHRWSTHTEGLGSAITRGTLRILHDGDTGLIFLVHGRGLWWIRNLRTDPVYARLPDPFRAN